MTRAMSLSWNEKWAIFNKCQYYKVRKKKHFYRPFGCKKCIHWWFKRFGHRYSQRNSFFSLEESRIRRHHLHSNVASVQNVIFTFKITDKLRFAYMPFLTRAIFTPFRSSIHTNSRLHLSLAYHQCCEIKSMIHFTALWLAPIHVAGHCCCGCCCYRNLLLCCAYLRCKMIGAS